MKKIQGFGKLLALNIRYFVVVNFYHGPALVGPWSCGHPIQEVTDHLTEQTRTNMSQPVQSPGTAVGNERHVLQALWSRKNI